MMWHLETFTAHLDGIHARPVAAMLLAGSLMGFVLGQEAGHTHMQRHIARPPVGAVATHTPAKPTPTKVPTISHVVNPVVSYQPPAAKPSGNGGHHRDGGGGDDSGGGDHGGGQGGHHHGNGQGGQGGHGGHGHHGGHSHGNGNGNGSAQTGTN